MSRQASLYQYINHLKSLNMYLLAHFHLSDTPFERAGRDDSNDTRLDSRLNVTNYDMMR